MTTTYREEEFEQFRRGETWGLAVTDAFGMGLDLPDVEIVVQWRVPPDMCTLWQRFGRAGRAEGSQAVAILFAERSCYDDEREKAAERAVKRKKKPGGKPHQETPKCSGQPPV
ncbi:P-loop containing nucleoside triphosphate hydrolase protein [Mycena floridula]|nr:P-loop containing nucleoside triphosphate hydrolase protein [Mycena floridula]